MKIWKTVFIKWKLQKKKTLINNKIYQNNL